MCFRGVLGAKKDRGTGFSVFFPRESLPPPPPSFLFLSFEPACKTPKIQFLWLSLLPNPTETLVTQAKISSISSMHAWSKNGSRLLTLRESENEQPQTIWELGYNQSGPKDLKPRMTNFPFLTPTELAVKIREYNETYQRINQSAGLQGCFPTVCITTRHHRTNT